MSIAAQKDRKEIDKAIANYRKKQGLKLTDKQKKLIAQGGSVRDISDSKTEKTELIIDVEVPEDKDSFNFRMNGALTFSYNETKYKIEFKKIADEDEEGKLYRTYDISDLTQEDKIEIMGEKVKFITDHPSSSYEVISNGQNHTIKINDPKSFWKVSKYLVIVVD